MTPAPTNHRTLRVIKLGGSLLDCQDLGPRFQAWLALQPAAANLVVAGGGELVEAIRRIDRVRPLGELAAHRLCIRAMSLTAELAARVLGAAVLAGWPLETDFVAVDDARPSVVDVSQFVAEDQQQSRDPLPESWQVTSDSIAARLAAVLGADELVLLKSSLPEGDALEELTAEGYVDGFFARAAVTRPLRFVNLRATAGGRERAWGELPQTAAASVSGARAGNSR
jgi:5-(aminomethyl)-3-furanmethanol phosphate kinase